MFKAITIFLFKTVKRSAIKQEDLEQHLKSAKKHFLR